MESGSSLERFMSAQEKQYQVALAEVGLGRKQTHWMWYIFPQIRGLGFSDMSNFYGIRDLEEAQLYLQHPLLGSRLIKISQALLRINGKNAHEVFGSPDDRKLQSSMTLFAEASPIEPVFRAVLDKFFNGVADRATLRAIGRSYN